MKISKAKLTKGGTLEVAFVDDDGNDVTMKGKNIVHEDLRNRLNALTPYFAELTEQREAPMIDWRNPGGDETQELLHRISVTGVSITGTDDLDRQCVLIGKRTLATSKVLNVTAPLTGFDPEMESYERCEDVQRLRTGRGPSPPQRAEEQRQLLLLPRLQDHRPLHVQGHTDKEGHRQRGHRNDHAD